MYVNGVKLCYHAACSTRVVILNLFRL